MCLRNRGAARKDFGEEAAAKGSYHGADLIGRDDRAVKLVRLISEVFVELFPTYFAGEAVAFIDIETFLDATTARCYLSVYLVNVIGDVHVVGDGVLVSVFHDEVLIKEADRLLRRRGGEADEVGVEVFEHLAPEIVDGAVAFIRDDEVEGLDRDVRVVNDRRRLFPKRLAELVAGAFVDLGVDLFAAQHGVKALECGDADAADAVELRGLQVLDVVKLGELAAVVGRDELLEFFQGLVAEVAAIDEEEYATRASELDEAVNEVDGGEGLAAAGGHLDEGAAFVGGEGFLEIADGFDLRGPQIRFRHLIRSQQVGKASVELCVGFKPFKQCFRFM